LLAFAVIFAAIFLVRDSATFAQRNQRLAGVALIGSGVACAGAYHWSRSMGRKAA
jgi:hypothetical protein